MYVNGVKQSDTASMGSLLNSDGDLDVGNWYLNGLVDQILIYNYTRTPAQIAWDYNQGAPLAWYKFDECSEETAYNLAPAASGGSTGINGTIVPGGVPNDQVGSCNSGDSAEMWNDGTTGKYSSSLGFDGTDDYVSLGNNAFGSPESYTISAWINTSYDYGSILSQYNGGVCGAKLFGIANGGVLVLSNGQSNNLYGNTDVTDSIWHHIAAVDSTAGAFLYIDGKLDKAGANVTWYTACTSTDVRIGKRVTPGSPDAFNGKIDDVKIFNYALSPEQVKMEYNGGAVSFR
jgi:hypothetical protein